MNQSKAIEETVDHFFRHESGKMVAVLCSLFGFDHIEQAQDITQETLLRAMQSWNLKGMPEYPTAWLYKTAKNFAIDFIRHENVVQRFVKLQTVETDGSEDPWHQLDDIFSDTGITDSQLKMMFACCHPRLKVKDQVMLILKFLCGLVAPEIAKAFFASEDAVKKKLQRIIKTIRAKKIKLEFPSSLQLVDAMDGVLKALYLLFNEGYYSSGEASIREDLCEEALCLCFLISQNKRTALPHVHALLALMCFQSSRFEARVDALGNPVLLRDQRRSKWHVGLVRTGNHYLEKASTGKCLHAYHIEAAIASLHCNSPAYEQTDWKQIIILYDLLMEQTSSPFVKLNRAIALSRYMGAKSGIAELMSITGLDKNRFYLAALADLHAELNENNQAHAYYSLAMKHSSRKLEHRFFEHRLQKLSESINPGLP